MTLLDRSGDGATSNSVTAHLAPSSWNLAGESDLQIVALRVSDSQFSDVLDVRSRVYRLRPKQVVDAVDTWSAIYVAYLDRAPVGSLRVTLKRNGPLDCEQYFPKTLLAAYGDRVGSASRFCVLPGVASEARVADRLLEAAWTDALKQGVLLDVINVHQRAIRYYRRRGYQLVRDSFFVHPLWHTPSEVMVFRASRSHQSPIQHLCTGLGHEITEQELAQCVNLV
jgi:ribosomal protein S18 acetylase RimI-like enzyme